MGELLALSSSSQGEIARVLARTLGRISQAQIQPPTKRSLTARAYSSAFAAYMIWAKANGEGLPSRSALERWRDMMEAEKLSTSTINKRLSAMRKLLRGAADEIVDFQIKLLLRDWAAVENAKATYEQDRVEEDYGRRLNQEEIRHLLDTIGVGSIKALRDQAIVTLGAGAGLRISEIVGLTVKDVFHTRDKLLKGIRIRRSKHAKSRIVVVGQSDNWVFVTVQQYCDVIGLDTSNPTDEKIIRGVHIGTGKVYKSLGTGLSVRQAQNAITSYEIMVGDQRTSISAHDLRRTYAMISKENGMEWEALRAQLGHSTVAQTERYVGKDVKWDSRVLTWQV